ncbi:DUF998 domain-containing protein [Nocardioides sp. CFH 31398]|uniref:DUF998 domain-containing protein n=1 Tax=Nocardioides sp. CFH 31398 TaxID=2919579 RepID=UPI001F0663D9|nr:DUF998 domain-containing protein [Nocardioides sp. CFH 31398]MCH1868492.1 DUF998 domain-containing protein [Nocardioides sp. CFH 31398]
MPRPSRARALTGGLVWLLVVQYVVVELLAVAAWTGTSYDAARDVVSDLGRPACLPDGGCSPWAAAFNASLGVHGLLVILGAGLLAPLLPRWRPAVVALFAITAAGNAGVGLFPLGEGVTGAHYVAATAAIGGATLAVGVTGVAALADPALRRYALATLVATGVGVLGVVLLVGDGTTGLAERIAIYPVVAWYVATGALALVSVRAGAPASRVAS